LPVPSNQSNPDFIALDALGLHTLDLLIVERSAHAPSINEQFGDVAV
jgi:hypothetical protein